MTEPERGLEPTDLRFTKPLLCQLSYSGISDIITEGEIAVNNHLMPASALRYTIPMDDKLQPSISALEQLSPDSQELVTNLIRQLAERENITIPLTPSAGLQTPLEGLALWEANMVSEGKSQGTIDGYKSLLLAYLKVDPFPTTLSIKQFLAGKMQGISPIGVGNYVRALRSLFSFLKAEGLWNTDPTAGIKKPKVGKKEREIPTEDEVAKLLTTLFADQDRKRDKPKAMAWIVTLITTGLRRNELATLSWDKVDFNRLEVRVLGKGNKERIVPIHSRTAQVLQEYRETLPNGELQVFPTTSKSGVWDTQASNLMIRRLCEKAGIRGFSAHAFRHFFTTYALKRGAKLEVISRILGHSSVGITAEVYRHVDRDEMHEEHQRFAPLSQPQLEEGK